MADLTLPEKAEERLREVHGLANELIVAVEHRDLCRKRPIEEFTAAQAVINRLVRDIRDRARQAAEAAAYYGD